MCWFSIAVEVLSHCFAGYQGHENERERLVMEHEAIVKEHASLENQLASVRMQINGLTSEVEEQKNKVSMGI